MNNVLAMWAQVIVNDKGTTFGTVFLGRHAETEWNRSGRIIGQKDSYITGEGLSRISTMAGMLKNQGINRIISSPLGRAAYTACMYSQILCIPLFFNPHLSELSAGKWEGQFRSELSHDGRTIRSSWLDRPPKGESYADAEVRVALLLEAMLRYKRETVLIVGHAGINKVILKMRLNLNPDYAFKVAFPHDVIYRIDHTDQVTLFDPQSVRGVKIPLKPRQGT